MITQEGIGALLFALPPLALTVPEFPQVPTHPRIEIPPPAEQNEQFCSLNSNQVNLFLTLCCVQKMTHKI